MRSQARRGRPIRVEQGIALLTVMLVMFVLSAIAIGGAIVVRLDVLIASQYRDSAEALFAAEAGLDAAIAELRTLPDWSAVVGGSHQSALSDGTFQGSKQVPGGGTVSLCCGSGSASYHLSIDTSLSPLPARRTLQWRPFLWTPVDTLAPRDPASRLYIVVWAGNDEEDTAGGEFSDTNATVVVRSEALQSNGIRRIVEALVARQPQPSAPPGVSEEQRLMRVAVLRWREVR